MSLEIVRNMPRGGGSTALQALNRIFDRLERGQLDMVTEDGAWRLQGKQAGPAATLAVHHPYRLLRRLATDGDLGLGEAFVAGDWSSTNLTALLQLLALNEEGFARIGRSSPLAALGYRLSHWLNRNSRAGSRRNIRYHYDIGNDFYRLWLDPSMTYSCALFDAPGTDLATAQERKYRRLLDSLNARPGDHVLEIGCGWGSFARLAAQSGLRVTGITLSEEQLVWGRRQIRQAGLEGRAELRIQDYRDLREQFDHVVSIEMFEAVGEAYWPSYMELINRSLKPGGRAALQFISIDEAFFERYRRNPDFIQKHVFPGGMLPSLPRFRAAAETAGLSIVQEDAFGADYARTLAHWHRRFLDAAPEIQALGYDERFRRMWRYYLAYCEAGFRTSRVDLMQTVMVKA